jgi:hypothetical protein
VIATKRRKHEEHMVLFRDFVASWRYTGVR